MPLSGGISSGSGDLQLREDLGESGAGRGAGLVGFIQMLGSGAAAVARTVQAKLASVVDVEDLGVIPGGEEDTAAQFQAAMIYSQLASVSLRARGRYLLLSGISMTVPAPADGEPSILWDFRGAQFDFPVSGGTAFQIERDGGRNYGGKIDVYGGTLLLTSGAVCGWFLRDCSGVTFWGPRVLDYTGGVGGVATAFKLANINKWCENVTVWNSQAVKCRIDFDFQAPSVSGGDSRSRSFARFASYNHFTSATEYTYLIQGAVYDSVIHHCKGNVQNTCKGIVCITADGSMAGSLVDGVVVERPDPGSPYTYVLRYDKAVAGRKVPEMRNCEANGDPIRLMASLPITPTVVSVVGPVLTLGMPEHGMRDGDALTLYGANDPAFSGVGLPVVYVDADTVSVTLAASPGGDSNGLTAVIESREFEPPTPFLYSGQFSNPDHIGVGIGTSVPDFDAGVGDWRTMGARILSILAGGRIGSQRIALLNLAGGRGQAGPIAGIEFYSSNGQTGRLAKIGAVRVDQNSDGSAGSMRLYTRKVGGPLKLALTIDEAGRVIPGGLLLVAPSGATTVDVSDLSSGAVVELNDTAAATLVSMTGGHNGQRILLYCSGGSRRTIQHGVGANLIRCNGGQDFGLSQGDIAELLSDGTTWRQIGPVVGPDRSSSRQTGRLYAMTASATVANTATNTALSGTGVGSRTIKAGAAVVGSVYRMIASGKISTLATTPGNLTITARISGSKVLATLAIADLPAGAVNLQWSAEIVATCRTAGASGSFSSDGWVEFETAAGTRKRYSLGNGSTVTAVDTTAALALEMLAQWQTANAANTLTCSTFVAEALP